VVRQGKVSSRLEKVGVREKKMKKILDHILKGRDFSSDMGEEICEGEEGVGKIGGRFFSDSVTWSNNLLITDKTSFRIRLFRRFRIRLNYARELRRRGTRGSTEIRINYDRSNYFL